MERLTKKFTDGGAYCEEIIDVGIKGINHPTYVGKAVNKLAEYEDLEEQGKLLKLPCAVGDTVYVKMQFAGYAEADVRDYSFFLSCGFCVVVTSDKFDKQHIPFKEFGKTVFLTKEAAEAALKAMME